MAGSASSSTMAGSLPPSSRVTRLRSGAADRATFLPVSTEPVKLILRGHGVRGHPRAELVAAAHDVEHPGREDVAQQLAHLERGQRRVGRGLEHQRVAGQQRRGDLPEGEGQREVPRRDGRHHAERAPGQLDVRRCRRPGSPGVGISRLAKYWLQMAEANTSMPASPRGLPCSAVSTGASSVARRPGARRPPAAGRPAGPPRRTSSRGRPWRRRRRRRRAAGGCTRAPGRRPRRWPGCGRRRFPPSARPLRRWS